MCVCVCIGVSVFVCEHGCVGVCGSRMNRTSLWCTGSACMWTVMSGLPVELGPTWAVLTWAARVSKSRATDGEGRRAS